MSGVVAVAAAIPFGCPSSSMGQGGQNQLTVEAGGAGSASPAGTTGVNQGTAITVTATPDPGCTFVGWSVSVGTATIANPASASTTVTLSSGNATVLASFAVTGGSGFLAWSSLTDSAHPDVLVRIARSTGAVSTIGGTGYMTALVYNPSGSTLYGVSDHLYTVTPSTGATSAGLALTYNSGPAILMSSAAFSPAGTLYVLENASPPRLFTVNTSTGALSLVGTVSVLAQCIAFAPDGTLYAGFVSLYKISTADASTVATVGSFGAYLDSMAFSAAGVLYGMDSFPSTHVYMVSTSYGATTPVVAVSGTACGALVVDQTSGPGTKSIPPLAGSVVQPSETPAPPVVQQDATAAAIEVENQIRAAHEAAIQHP